MIAVADTGFVVALLHRGDKNHKAAAAVYQRLQTAYLPQSALAEVAYLLTNRAGGDTVVEFLRRLPTSKLSPTALTNEDLSTTASILKQYASSRIDFVDATVMAVAERLNITTVLTVDYRDFRLYRPKHCAFFTLLPNEAY